MPEGNETRGDEPGPFGEGTSALRSEGDLLAERRARRAAESGELALTRRAEAAEATVQTLERHVASLQQRLRDVEDEQRMASELLEAEKAAALEREHELRRVKQREYAEQQLRVEAEERLIGSDRESRGEIERLARRLSASERDAAELTHALEDVQRQLAEAEHAAESERAALRRGEYELHERLGELERRALELQQGLAAERTARERSERELAGMRQGHRQMAGLLVDLKGIVERLGAGLAAAPRPSAPTRPLPASLTTTARVAGAAQAPPRPRPTPSQEASEQTAPSQRALGPEARGAEMADALAAAVERLRARAQEAPELAPEHVAPAVVRPTHKHALSLIGRWRFRRKQRRGG